MAFEKNESLFPMFRDFIPEKFRFWIIVIFPFIFQMSNPIFMGLATQQAGDLSLLSEDIMLCGYTCIIGITCTFPIVFRLKFRFTTRQILLIVTASLILLNFIAAHCRFMPVLVVVSFLYGCFKLWGTFECASSCFQKLSPNFRLPPFLMVVFLAVFGGVELSIISGTYITYFYQWRYVSYFIMGTLLLVALCAVTLMRDFRFKPPVPLLSVDWLGMLLWGITLVSCSFVFIYGDCLDWFHSSYIVVAASISLIAFGVNFGRMMHIRHPYVEPSAFRMPNLWPILVIFMISGLLMSTQSVLEHIFTGSILHFGVIPLANLNWMTLLGVIVGAFFTRFVMMRLDWNARRVTFLSMLFTTMYVVMMFFLISPDTRLQQLYLPSFLCGLGHVTLFIALTTYMEEQTPPQFRYQILMVLGFIRTGIASPIGGAMFGHLFKIQMKDNMAWMDSALSHISVNQLPRYAITDELVRQSMLVSVRNLFGIAIIMGLVTMILILAFRFKNPKYRAIPTLHRMYKIAKASAAR